MHSSAQRFSTVRRIYVQGGWRAACKMQKKFHKKNNTAHLILHSFFLKKMEPEKGTRHTRRRRHCKHYSFAFTILFTVVCHIPPLLLKITLHFTLHWFACLYVLLMTIFQKYIYLHSINEGCDLITIGKCGSRTGTSWESLLYGALQQLYGCMSTNGRIRGSPRRCAWW